MLDLAARPLPAYPADLRRGAGIEVDKSGNTARLRLDYRNIQKMDSAPTKGLLPVQDPDTGEFQALDFTDLPTATPGPDSVANTQLKAMPSLSVKGNATGANAQPQDVPLSTLAGTGNPIGDAISVKAGRVASVAALKAAAVSIGALIVISDPQRGGLFAWQSGDFTLGITSDPRNACYIQANGVAASLGAWVRVGDWATQGVPIQWFGLTFADDTAAIQAAVNFAVNLATKRVLHGSQTLTFSSTLSVPAGVQVVGNRIGGWVQAAGMQLRELVTLGSGAALRDLTIDGNWASNPYVSGSYVGVRIGASDDCTVAGCMVRNVPGLPIVVNTGARPRILENLVANFRDVGVAVYGNNGLTDPRIIGNRFRNIGWTAIHVENTVGGVTSGNDAIGTYIGRPGARVTVNTSGSVVTWVSGPKFDEIQEGQWLVVNVGQEYRILSKQSNTQVTVDGTIPTLSNTPALLGSGDLAGLGQTSLHKLIDNSLRDTTTFGTGFTLGVTSAASSGNEISRNKIANTGKNGINGAASTVGGGGGFCEHNRVADNHLVSTGSGGAAVGLVDRIGIYISGPLNLSIYVTDNLVSSYSGDGQTAYWLGVDGAQNNGSVIAQGNRAEGIANGGVFNGVKSITLSSHWGSTAAVSSVFTDGRNVSFTLTSNGTGLAAGGSFTIQKIVEASTDLPIPVAKAVNGSGYLPTLWGENQSTRGIWVAYQRDNLTPAAGQTFQIFMKD